MLSKILFSLSAIFSLFAEEAHLFSGKHFFASYLGCDLRAIADLQGLLQAMDEAVRASGATVLDHTLHVFPPNGLTIVYLLSESHASLHTYPEHGACFVDLFTCGEQCTADGFDAALRLYLRPTQVEARSFLRHEGIEEIPYCPALNGQLEAQSRSFRGG